MMSTRLDHTPIRMEDHLGYLIKRLQHVMRSRFEARMRQESVDLTFPVAMVLGALVEEPGLSGARLARRSMVSPQTVNTLLTRLQQLGLIERRPDPEHKRVLRAYVTAAGYALLERGAAVADHVTESMLSKLDRDERRQLGELLHRCLDSLSEMKDPVIS